MAGAIHTTQIPTVRRSMDRVPGLRAKGLNGFGRGTHACPACRRDEGAADAAGRCKRCADLAWHAANVRQAHAAASGGAARVVTLPVTHPSHGAHVHP